MKTVKTLLKSGSLAATLAIGKSLGANLKGSEVIELVGDLGSGKTTLVKGIAEGAGSSELVSSPSFTITNQYKTLSFTIYHFDFFRVNDAGILQRELDEVAGDKQAVVIIEWPAVIENTLPKKRLVIRFSSPAENSRLLNVSYPTELNYLLQGLAQ